MYWNHYLHEVGSAVQKGLHTGLNVLEAGVGLYGTLKGAAEIGGLLRGAAYAAPAAALL